MKVIMEIGLTYNHLRSNKSVTIINLYLTYTKMSHSSTLCIYIVGFKASKTVPTLNYLRNVM